MLLVIVISVAKVFHYTFGLLLIISQVKKFCSELATEETEAMNVICKN